MALVDAQVAPQDGLDRSGYHYPHGKQYYKDGRICDAPKRVDEVGDLQAVSQSVSASQSKWNFDDYHWEERDLTDKVISMLGNNVIGTELWRDKNSSDAFVISSCTIDGWVVSNVRKGSTKNLWEFAAKFNLHGIRGGAELHVCVTFPGLDQDVPSSAIPQPVIESKVGSNLIREKVVAEDGSIIERIVGEVNSERAMKTNEMFLKLVRRKGIAILQKKVEETLNELIEYGKQSESIA